MKHQKKATKFVVLATKSRTKYNFQSVPVGGCIVFEEADKMTEKKARAAASSASGRFKNMHFQAGYENGVLAIHRDK